MTPTTEIVQSAESLKEILVVANKDPRIIAAVNIASRVGNVLSIYKSRASLKGIQKQESHQAKVRKIKRLLMQRYENQKVKILRTAAIEKKAKAVTPSEAREMQLTKYASFCFLLEGFRMGARQVPIIDAATIVGTGLLACAEKKKTRLNVCKLKMPKLKISKLKIPKRRVPGSVQKQGVGRSNMVF
jgi:hypothetical protein